ncbi:MAG TPA: homoserine dehydrogenase [Actinomycetota bacterium]|jgi:homoserine dehydrogenase|nr:homoserine dehydrogenase [Actinomycetota bacterium]
MAQVISVGMLGCGIVGSAVARTMESHAAEIADRVGARLEIRKVAVRNVGKERDVPLDKSLFTNDATEVIRDPQIQILVEVMGGIEPARTLILDAMRSGKHVVSANKELIGTLGRELFDEAEASNVDFFFEASVAGGIPIIRPLKESLSGEKVDRVMGILNGTTNYILTRMSEEGMEFDQALAEAERLGYSELDPTADIEGFDAAAKLSILASIAFNARVVAGDVYREGITHVSARDIAFARNLGYAVKLLAIAEALNGEIALRVHPAMIPETHPLASVRENLNAIFIEGQQVGELMFYGRGAGGPPTSISVVGDVVGVARHMVSGGRGVGPVYTQPARIRPMDQTYSQYYVLLEVADKPGVLAQVASKFSDNDVSIKSVWQEGYGDEASLVMVTHTALEQNVQSLLSALRTLEDVKAVTSSMRVQSAED